jgi:cytochrome d ubiquinol oxidase subunit I
MPDPRETAFEAHSADLGFAFLLKRYVDDPREATPDADREAA